jgi:hypothetical protein
VTISQVAEIYIRESRQKVGKTLAVTSVAI